MKNDIGYSPVLLFVYNRQKHTKRLIDSLKMNLLSQDTDLIIYSDGPKSTEDLLKVKEVRQYIHSIEGFRKIKIIERETNYGLASNIIDGVTTQLKEYGKVIVIEDDLILSPYFLKFMNDALEIYKDEERVGHIQAYNYNETSFLPDTFLIKWTGSWGWATWERAWKHFNTDGKQLLKQLEERNLTKVFDFNGSYRYTRMLRHQIEGKNNSWAIRWNASLFLKDILSLNVGKSLVQNKGFDGSGTHCGKDNLYESNLYQEEVKVIKINPIQENSLAREAFKNYYKKNYSFKAKAIRRIKRILKGDFGS